MLIFLSIYWPYLIPRPAIPLEEPDLKVLTYNILQGNSVDGQENYDGQLAILRQADADVQARIDEALKLQERLGKRMGQIVVDKGWVSENDVLRCLSEQLGVPFVRLRPGLFDPSTAALLDVGVARRLGVMPLFRVRSVCYLATSKPQDMPTFEEVGERLQCRVRPILARHEDIWHVSRNPSLFCSGQGSNIGDLPREMNEFFGSMINMDDPRHFRLRSIVSKGFTPREPSSAMKAKLAPILTTTAQTEPTTGVRVSPSA